MYVHVLVLAVHVSTSRSCCVQTMDVSKVKMCSSLRWLAGIVARRQADSPTHAASLTNMLLDPYTQETQLRSEVVALLTDPNVYLSAYGVIFPQESLQRGTFWPLIHGLARHGVYLMEGDTAVNHTVLAQNNPFREASHLALLDGLMSVYASSTVTVERVVKAVRQLSTFNPSKELPCGIEDALLLWLNKVSQAVCTKQKETTDMLLQEPDARQRRRNRLKMMGMEEPLIPPTEDLCCGTASGQCLAALMVHYVPQIARWSDFCFGEKFFSQSHCLRNLSKVRDICNSNLPPPGFHLNPKEMVLLCQSDTLKTNIVALLASLFVCFEVQQGSTVANGLGPHKSSETLQESLSRKRSLFGKDKRPPHSHSSLYSYSMSDIPTAHHHVQNGTSRISSRERNHSHNLSSFSTSALVNHHHPATNATSPRTSSTVFNAPIRSLLTVPQAAALASFSKQMQLPGQDERTTHYPNSELITASTENLHIQEQMISERMSRNHKQQSVRYNASLSSSSNDTSSIDLSTSGAADVSGNCAESWPPVNNVNQLHPHPASTDASPSEPVTASTNSDSSKSSAVSQDLPDAPVKCSSSPSKHSVQFYVDVSTTNEDRDGETRRSFTLDKWHTMASASAAGLPIISNNASEHSNTKEPPSDDCTTSHKVVRDTDRVGAEAVLSDITHPNKAPDLGPKPGGIPSSHAGRSTEVSSSESSVTSTPTVVVLNFFPKAERNKSGENKPSSSSSVPPEILELRQKLKEKEAEIRMLQSMREKQLLLERQKFQQKLYLALMERQQNRPLVAAAHNLPQTEPENHHQLSDTKNWSDTPQQTANQPVLDILHPTFSEPALSTITVHPDLKPTGSLTDVQKARPSRVHATAKPTASPDSQCSAENKMPPATSQPSITQLPFSPILRPSTPGGDNDSTSLPAHNPWATPLQQKGAERRRDDGPSAKKMPVQEDAMRRRQEQLRARLEERQRAMKNAIEQRKKEQILKNTYPGAVPKSSEATLYEASVRSNEDSGTLHFKLSNMGSHPSPSDLQQRATATDFLTHNGPECYIKPQAKSNRRIIRNALCHVCLAGEVNMTVKQRALAELDASTANHFLVLFRDIIGFKFRALYSYTPDTDHIIKVFGSGPKYIRQHMVSHLYKYNSGLKEFKEIPTKSFSISVDALTMQNDYWTSKKSKLSSGIFR